MLNAPFNETRNLGSSNEASQLLVAPPEALPLKRTRSKEKLQPKLKSIELFTGAGGLALGISMAGFDHLAVLERDHDSCETLRYNKSRGVEHVKHWQICEGDIKQFEFANSFRSVDLIAGGVPCQPFSLGGKHKAYDDARDMFPEFSRAVTELRPKAFIVENVKGLLRQSFADYFEYVLLRLSHPHIEMRAGTTWREHRAELERAHTSRNDSGLGYQVVFQLLNAADFGVPQRRERVFIVGFRSDLNVDWSFPLPTHSRDELLLSQYDSGEYWERHRIQTKHRPEPSALIAEAGKRLKSRLFVERFQPWRTVRDAISDLPKLDSKLTNSSDSEHFMNPGARSYKGHTGSPYDEPAKTLKAGDHGVPGGENTLALPDGRVRYFTVRECARLQTFPDTYHLTGSWTERMRQLGNAVPVSLAHIVAKAVQIRLSQLA